ncbi:hypothetical protein RRG08_066924 [Elysia crispata]|uniref:Uncharacterized protein n=1 Tax=Elysia crispata TaxID=231223 RepID=A0AAE1AP15_9GAST|nr:hypothetical protein RRG08_066924 [Elysia crispata]
MGRLRRSPGQHPVRLREGKSLDKRVRTATGDANLPMYQQILYVPITTDSNWRYQPAHVSTNLIRTRYNRQQLEVPTCPCINKSYTCSLQQTATGGANLPMYQQISYVLITTDSNWRCQPAHVSTNLIRAHYNRQQLEVPTCPCINKSYTCSLQQAATGGANLPMYQQILYVLITTGSNWRCQPAHVSTNLIRAHYNRQQLEVPTCPCINKPYTCSSQQTATGGANLPMYQQILYVLITTDSNWRCQPAHVSTNLIRAHYNRQQLEVPTCPCINKSYTCSLQQTATGGANLPMYQQILYVLITTGSNWRCQPAHVSTNLIRAHYNRQQLEVPTCPCINKSYTCSLQQTATGGANLPMYQQILYVLITTDSNWRCQPAHVSTNFIRAHYNIQQLEVPTCPCINKFYTCSLQQTATGGANLPMYQQILYVLITTDSHWRCQLAHVSTNLIRAHYNRQQLEVPTCPCINKSYTCSLQQTATGGANLPMYQQILYVLITTDSNWRCQPAHVSTNLIRAHYNRQQLEVPTCPCINKSYTCSLQQTATGGANLPMYQQILYVLITTYSNWKCQPAHVSTNLIRAHYNRQPLEVPTCPCINKSYTCSLQQTATGGANLPMYQQILYVLITTGSYWRCQPAHVSTNLIRAHYNRQPPH